MTPTIVRGWEKQRLPATAANIQAAIADAATRYVDAYVIVENGPDHYIQCYHETKGFILEKREGSAEQHFRARSRKASPSMNEFPELWERLLEIGPRFCRHFDVDEIVAAFCAYVENKPVPVTFEWRAFKV